MNFPPPTERQARIIWLALTGLAIALVVALLAALVWGLGHVLRILSPVLWPLAVAGVLAYLLDPVVDFLERKRIPRRRSIIIVFALALVILAGILASVVPQMIKETRQLAERIPDYVAKVEERVEYWVNHPPSWILKWIEREPKPPTKRPGGSHTNSEAQSLPPETAAGSTTSTNTPSLLQTSLDKDTIQTATAWLAKALPKVGSWLLGQLGRVAGWFGVLAGLALIPIYAYYLLLEKRGIESRWTDYLPVTDSDFKNELVFVIRSINNYLIAFFRGQVLVAICDGVLYTIGFLIIDLPYAVLLGAVAIFLTLIPFLGAIITCAVALILAFAQYGDWLHPLLVLAVFAVVQTLEGLVISPKIMGDRMRLHPLTIIIAVMAGTTLLGGILGGILAIPLTAVLKVVLSRYVWKRPAPESPT